ncbi:hypothetical protein [Rossellomorea vietnamensis]|uniref:hypothetical protein n=1 Tax=Rossellomorea vietnamensis TaxID=218284 RepID=UPI0033146C4C
MMKKHWNEIQPIDHYTVGTHGMLQEYDRKIITFLYQPLIGTVCYSLYMSLWGKWKRIASGRRIPPITT